MGSKKDDILRLIKELNDDDYKQVLYGAFDQQRPSDINRSIVKYFSRKGSEWSKNGEPVPGKLTGRPFSGKPEVSASAVDEPEQGTSSGRSSALVPCTSVSRSAWQTPFICRGDLIPQDGLLFFDVEKLDLKATGKKHKQVASDVAVVDKSNELVVWAFIKWKIEDICRTVPSITGITKQKLQMGLEIEIVKPVLEMAFNGNRLVGWDMRPDIAALLLSAGNYKLCDLADYYRDDKGPFKLRDTAAKFFPGKSFQCALHSAIQDARMTRDLYYKMLELQKDDKYKYRFSEIQRTTGSSYKFDINDRCTCFKKKN